MSGVAARPLSRKEAQGAESRRRILEAASRLMSERGFAGTSISAVSRRSGLPASSIYWHFGSKEGLLGAVVEEGARRWFEELPGPEALPLDPERRAEALFEASARSLEQHPEFLRLLLLIALERREIDSSSLASVRRARELALERLREMIRLLVDDDEALVCRLSSLALAVGDGAFIQHHIDPEGTDVRGLFDLLRRLLLVAARERELD